MNTLNSKYLYLPFILMSLLGFQFLASNTNFFFQKKSDLSTFISFGSHQLAIRPVSEHLTLPVNEVDWSNLGSPSSFTVNNERRPKTRIKRVDVFVESTKNHGIYNASVIDSDFWKSIQSKFGKEATIYMRVTDATGKQYASILSNTPRMKVNSEQLIGSSFFDFESLSILNTFKKVGFDESFSSLSLRTESEGAEIPITYITNETAQENVDCTIDFLSRGQDSLHVLIKYGHGSMLKMRYAPSDTVKLKSLLAQHVEETTIYFCEGSPNSIDRKLGVLVISDQKKMHAVQPNLLNSLVGMSMNEIVSNQMFFSPANIDFVWGDIELRLTKNKEGNYHGKKRIGKSKWDKSLGRSPNLMLGKTLNMDSLSFDFSIASQHKDTMNKVKIENVHSHDFGSTIKINLNDTLLSVKERSSIIRIEDIQNEGLNNGNISLELEIYDDTPRVKEKKYQLHWGDIDTTLTQRQKKKFFSESLAMGIGQFEQLLTKEPVLTSSTKGVLDSFDFLLVHQRGNKKLQSQRIETNIKDAKVFLQSMEKFKLEHTIEVGDQFSLQKFKGEELPTQETLFFEILINDDKPEKESIDDSNVFLNWGESILKSTPLLDNSRKKRIQDQIIEKSTLLNIVKGPAVLNRYGVKEAIVGAEWFINEDIYTKQKCNTKWEACFADYINDAKAGDFVSLFLRTKNGNGAICQFYLDRIKGEDIIGYGNTEFDSLLFKYAKQTYRSETKPKYDYNFVWGDSEFTLELKGNPRVFGGAFKINQEELEDLLDEKIYISSSDGEVISIKHAYIFINDMISRNVKRNKKFVAYDFDCANFDCALSTEDVQKLLQEFENEVHRIRVFVNQHDQSEEFVKVSFIDFIIENESNAWVPKDWVSSNVDMDIFEFQFVYQEKEKTLVKLDKQNEKYQWIVDKYENDPAVDIIDIPSFKTIQRAIYTKNDKGANKEIRTTEVLSKDYTNAYTLNDYHDLREGQAKLFWKGYQSLYRGQSYCKDDFICADGELYLQIDGSTVPILRGDLVILPESGSGYKFIFDDIDSMEIITILKDIPAKTNLFFENIIVPDDKGERVRLPLKFAYHLE